jgi:hypothetical protein
MKRYRVAEPAAVELVDSLGERFEVAFEAGEHEATSEHEEQALEHLRQHGHASIAAGKAATKTKGEPKP